jgi:hypothetical protein
MVSHSNDHPLSVIDRAAVELVSSPTRPPSEEPDPMKAAGKSGEGTKWSIRCMKVPAFVEL